jgi:hypothetical protein
MYTQLHDGLWLSFSCTECHINLRPRCSEADRNSTGSVCLDDISIVSESTSNQCGLHVVAFDVDTCTAVNVTVFDASDRLTVLETDVRRFINGLPLGTALAGHSTCAMQASTASAILSIVGGNGTSLNGDTKFAFVGQTGYRLKTLSMADGCDTSSIQLCVVVSGRRGLHLYITYAVPDFH